jgi:uncharacterized Zn-binding protein involved in type VI secretion
MKIDDIRVSIGLAGARRTRLRAMLTIGLAFSPAGFVVADEPAPQPGALATIIEASPNVSIGGVGAARQGDGTSSGHAVITGSPDVFINGKPAARSGDVTGCSGIVVGSGASVFINGKPAAGLGDQARCPAH